MIGKNNPLNIRYNRLNSWRGQTGQTKGFCDFESEFYCVRACLYLLAKSYRRRGLLTFEQLISAYAPPSENKTSIYVSYVCRKLCVNRYNKPQSLSTFLFMITYMSNMEGNPISAIKYFSELREEFYRDFDKYCK